MSETDTTLHLGEAAAQCGVPVRWLKAEAQAGRLPHLIAGGFLIFNLDALKHAIAARAAETPPPHEPPPPSDQQPDHWFSEAMEASALHDAVRLRNALSVLRSLGWTVRSEGSISPDSGTVAQFANLVDAKHRGDWSRQINARDALRRAGIFVIFRDEAAKPPPPDEIPPDLQDVELVTADELARRLGITTEAVLSGAGRDIPAVPIGSTMLFDAVAVERFLLDAIARASDRFGANTKLAKALRSRLGLLVVSGQERRILDAVYTALTAARGGDDDAAVDAIEQLLSLWPISRYTQTGGDR